MSITGGTDKTQFMLSYNYNDQDGIMARHGYKKNSVRAKINHELWKGVRLDFNTNFQSTNIEGGGSLGGTLKKTILQPVTGGIRYTNDQMLHVDLGDEMAALDSQYDLNNPILENNAVQQNKITRQYSVNAGVEIDLYKGLTWRTAGSYIWSQARSDYWDDGTTRSARDYKPKNKTKSTLGASVTIRRNIPTRLPTPSPTATPSPTNTRSTCCSVRRPSTASRCL